MQPNHLPLQRGLDEYEGCQPQHEAAEHACRGGNRCGRHMPAGPGRPVGWRGAATLGCAPSRTVSQEGEELGVRKGRLQRRGTDGWLRHAGSPDPEQGLAVG